ncbi:hypothetical protein MNBD_UNCLBAC01-1475 [hydrothermal vent metagenome]|uniref:Uncharacterized protein n=1 Tax=hydrothermal vent metagenome TaxID=652676 RepID=A0A3B1CW30_9ZZZZ
MHYVIIRGIGFEYKFDTTSIYLYTLIEKMRNEI